MEQWTCLILLVTLVNGQLHSHLVPPNQDGLGHLFGQQGSHLGHVHPAQTQAIIRNPGSYAFGSRQRATITIHGPNPGQVQSETNQLQSAANQGLLHLPRQQGSAQQQILLQQQGQPQQHNLHQQQNAHQQQGHHQQTLPQQSSVRQEILSDQPDALQNLAETQQVPQIAAAQPQNLSQATQNVSGKSLNLSQQLGQSPIDQANPDVKNHALFYRSTNSSPTNKYHRAREDLSRAYLPADLSSTQEPRPFQTQKYSPQPTTPATNNYGGSRGSTSQQSIFPSTPGYQLPASQAKGTTYPNPPGYNTKQSPGARGYQQPFQPQSSYSTGQDKPTKTYIPPQPSFQPPTQQENQSQNQQGGYPTTQQAYQPNQQGYQPNQQGYQPNQQGYQSTQQGSYQPNQQGYQSTQQGYQPSTQQGYQPSTQQGYQPSGQTPQGYQPSSSLRPTFSPQTSTTQQPFYSSSTNSPGSTQQSYTPSVIINKSSTYAPEGYPAASKPSPSLPDGPGYPEPVNTVQPPFYTEDDNQITGAISSQGPQSSSVPGTQFPSTNSGGSFRPDTTNPQNVGNHPPHIHELNVQCSKESMTVNIEFNEAFNGVIYSKGHHNEPECRYVQPNSASTKFSFTLNLNSCGTQYIEDFASGNPAYLENTLVIQNEPGILEIWDYIRNVKCLWEGSITQSLSTGLSIDGLNQEVVTFSGDTAKAKLELQAGRGPFSYENVNLVRIGDLMTLVITVDGDNGFNIRVGECVATDGQANSFNRISLTDDRGCTIKDKVMGAFQFTRNPNSGASVAYAFFRAFKFPDVMDLAIECSVQLCKTECAPCPDPDQLIEPRRRRRWIQNATEEIFEELRLRNKIQVFLPEDLPSSEMSFSSREEHQICITPSVFYSTTSLLLILTSVSTLAWMYFWYKAMSAHRKL